MTVRQEETTRWRKVCELLRRMVKKYDSRQGKKHLNVESEVAERFDCSIKTIRRDLGEWTEELHKIKDSRIEEYVQWLFEAGASFEEVAQWADLTDHKWPGELVLKTFRGIKRQIDLYNFAKPDWDLPRLEIKLWISEFLGRDDEIKKAMAWADDRRHFPVAILHGFGGSGKTTLQLKLGWDFILGSPCSRSLRWPFEGVVWIAAGENPALSLPVIWRKIAKVFEHDDDSLISGASNPQWVERVVRSLLEEKRVLVLIDSFESLSSPDEQVAVLKFFNNLKGCSKALLSSRDDLNGLLVTHGLLNQTRYIKVEGLSPEHTDELIDDYIERWSVPAELVPPSELDKLAKITGNNPQVIIAALGAVREGRISLADLMDSIATGKQQPKADEIFELIIGQVWNRFLKKHDKSVLMAKAFFGRPVLPDDLGRIAGVDKPDLETACDTLKSISFFYKERSERWRIFTHPLAQAYALRMIQHDADSQRQMETRWWRDYASRVLKEASKVSYESVEPALNDSIADVLAHIEKHLAAEESQHRMKAVKLFLQGDETLGPRPNNAVSSYGIGHILRHWGWWDDLIRVATLCLEHTKHDPRLIRECVLRLLTRAYYERRDSDEARNYIVFAKLENVRLKDKRLEAAILYSEAEVLRQRGDFQLAIACLQNALKIFSQDGGKYTCDIAPTYMVLGGCTTELVAQNLTGAIIDEKDDLAVKGLREAESYLDESERLFESQGVDYPEKRFDVASIRAYRAVIARLRSEFDVARNLFETCEGQFPSISSVARLHRERALVEHLADNKELAYQYEDKGLALMERVGLKTEQLPNYNCYRVIKKMKFDRTW